MFCKERFLNISPALFASKYIIQNINKEETDSKEGGRTDTLTNVKCLTITASSSSSSLSPYSHIVHQVNKLSGVRILIRIEVGNRVGSNQFRPAD